MTYKLLLEQLPKTCSLAQLSNFFHLLQLDLMRPLSETVQQHAQNFRAASTQHDRHSICHPDIHS